MKNESASDSNSFQKRVFIALVFLFFSGQLLGIMNSRFTSTNFFSWAPYDQISYYEIEVQKQGQSLSSESIRNRYHISAKGRENRSIHNIISMIRQYESTYGKGEEVSVTIFYRINGHETGTWKWPGDKFD